MSAPQSASRNSLVADNGASSEAKTTDASTTQQKKASNPGGAQFLIKSLRVMMQVTETRQVAKDIQTWLSTTDQRATSSGADFQRVGDDRYNITLTFIVQASLYPRIQQYLIDYAPQHGGRFLSANESVEDVTNTYVDTQSRLKNLRAEQSRLLELLTHAQTLSEILAIEQRLTDVEEKIESSQAQMNTLTSRITFYPVTIVLEPMPVKTPPPAPVGWHVGQTFRDAFAASLAFAQGLATFLIWLLAFSVYIVLPALMLWLARKWYSRSHAQQPTGTRWPQWPLSPPLTGSETLSTYPAAPAELPTSPPAKVSPEESPQVTASNSTAP
jgi:hypothetical protein